MPYLSEGSPVTSLLNAYRIPVVTNPGVPGGRGYITATNFAGSTYYPTAQTSAGIQAAIDAARAADGGVVQLSGTYSIDTTVKTYSRIHITGKGPAGGGASLVATAGLTGNMIESANITDASGDYLHYATVTNVYLLGNTLAGGGIVFLRAGELTTIDQVMVTNCYSHGIEIRGSSTPVHLGFISVHGNGRDGTGAGLYFNAQNLTHNSVVYVSGDNNGGSLVLIESLYRASVHIMNFKSERGVNEGWVGNPNVIDVNHGDGGLVLIGAGHVFIVPSGVTGANAIIRNRSTTDFGALAQVVCYGGISYDPDSGPAAYAYDYEEISPGGTFTLPIWTNPGRPFVYRSRGTLHTLTDGSAAVEIARINSGAGTTYSVKHKRPASAAAHFQITEAGVAEWGDATNAVDTNLYRSAANVLKTDDTLAAALGLLLTEQTAPSAPATNNVILYAVDNGSGKTKLMALFPTGAAVQVAIEP